MSRRFAGRAVLVVLALVVIGPLAYDLRALSLDAQGSAAARIARSPAQVTRALSLFARSARDNADPGPRIDAARFLISLGRTHRAIGILNAVVRTNPGNIVAWSLLAAATARTDPSREAQANQQLFGLFGHPVIYFPAQSTIFSPIGVVSVADGQVHGAVDSVRVTGRVAQFSGWSAVTSKAGASVSVTPSMQVLILAGGRFIAGATPTIERSDVAHLYRVAAAPVGFTIAVPVRELKSARGSAGVQVFGASPGVASKLPVICGRRAQAFGCGS